MRSTRSTRRSSASTSRTCSSRSPTTASRRSRSSRCSIRSNSVDVVVVDSVAALVPKAEIEGEMGEAQMGLQARLMSQALRKLTGVVSKSNTTLVFINQLREKIGVMFGNPETTTGGRALKFYASVRIDIRRIASIKDGDQVIGGRTRVKVVKNKVAPPFREAEFDIMYGEGISREGDLLDLAVEKRIVEKSGAWFAYAGERLGQGRENAKQFLKENVDIRQAIEDRVRKELGLVRESRGRDGLTCSPACCGSWACHSWAGASAPALSWYVGRVAKPAAPATSYPRAVPFVRCPAGAPAPGVARHLRHHIRARIAEALFRRACVTHPHVLALAASTRSGIRITAPISAPDSPSCLDCFRISLAR